MAAAGDVTVRVLQAADLDVVDTVMRVAFGTFLGVPDPMTVFGDKDYARGRFAAEPSWAFVAELDGEVVGSNFATRWGSYAFFGPLTVRPDLWDRGVASRLLERTVELFDRWGVTQSALFTFPQSTKHIGLYQKFGFWPQHLTPVMAKPIAPSSDASALATYSALPAGERDALLLAAAQVTDAIYPGLDIAHEIRSTAAQSLGDTVLVHDGSQLVGFAVCHCNAGEAGSGKAYVKFGAVRPGADAGARFERLLDACEMLAAQHGVESIEAGVNMARHDAYRRMFGRGYRTQMQGVILQRPNEPGYCRADVHVIDDLR